MRLLILVVLFFAGCGAAEPEPYVLKATDQEIKDSIDYYDSRLHGVWYRPGKSIREYEFISGTVNILGLTISRYELINPHELVIYNPEGYDNDSLSIDFRGDTLIIYDKNTVGGPSIYTRSP